MPSPFPIQVTADDGVTTLRGEATFTDPDNQPGGVQGFEVLNCAPVAITDGSTDPLTWDALDSGEALLDLSDPTGPTVIAAGVYAITAPITPTTDITAAGFYFARLLAGSVQATGSSPAASAADAQPALTLTAIATLTAGAPITVSVNSNDGAATVHYKLDAPSVQRLA